MSSSTKDVVDLNLAIERGHEADQRAVVWALVVSLISLVMIGVNVGFMYSHLEGRVVLTSIEVFHDWAGLRQIFQDTVSYDPRFNLPSLDYYSLFETSGGSLEVLEDLRDRGLVSDADFKKGLVAFNKSSGQPLAGSVDPRILSQLSSEFFSKFSGMLSTQALQVLPPSVMVSSPGFTDPRILARLMKVSGCSFPDALPGATPMSRSLGCKCIADTYLNFVKASVNMSSNVSTALREGSSTEVLKCIDRRVTWHTWGAGKNWTLHPSGLALYSSCVIFFVCASFLISFNHEHLFPDSWDVRLRTAAIKFTLTGIIAVFVLLFALHDWESNLFQMAGLFLVLFNFFFSAYPVLDYAGKGLSYRSPFTPAPHPLVVCFWIYFPMLLPAALMVVALSGYLRDAYGLCGVGVLGAIFAIILQRVFWYVWYDDHKYIAMVFPPIMFALFDLFVCLVVLLMAYRSDLEVYAMSSVVVILLMLSYIAGMSGVLWYDFHVFLQASEGLEEDAEKEAEAVHSPVDLNQCFEDGHHGLLFLVTAVMLIALTALTSSDSKLR